MEKVDWTRAHTRIPLLASCSSLLRCVARKFLPSGALVLFCIDPTFLVGVNDVLRVVVDFHRFHLDQRLRGDTNHRMGRHGVANVPTSSTTAAATSAAVIPLGLGVG